MSDTMRIMRDGGRFNPRTFSRHYLKEIGKVVLPKSENEQRMSIFLGLLIGVPFASALLWRTATLGSHSFWERSACAFGVLFIFNLVDLLILDWLIVCGFEPRWAILPGTAHIVIPKLYPITSSGF